MKKIPINNIIQRIHQDKDISTEEIKKKIAEKVSELSGLVSEEGAAHIVANEYGVQIFQDKEPVEQDMKLKDLKSNMRNLVVTGKIMNIFDLVNFERDSNPGKVRSIIIADETGRARVSLWHHATEVFEGNKVEVGTILKLSKVSSRENNGRVDLSVQNPEDIEINPEGIKIDVPDNSSPINVEVPTKKLVELKEGPASVMATVVQIYRPNFYQKCPKCNKKVTDNKCILHGEVDSKTACILNIVIDDGSDSIRAVFFNDQVESFTNITLEDLKIEENLEKFKEEILGSLIKIKGTIRYSSFLSANEMVVNSIKKLDEIDMKKEESFL